MENKSEKFIRLAEKRANDIINKLRLIGNLSNRRNYDYSEKEVKELFSAIEKEIATTKNLFYSELNKEDSKFKFKK
ncbi:MULTISPECIES: hypothetical protein [Enterococcus]|uniref:hypothetical protein n=1 Tax=Enterococcus TaxID=1350 RepID=UPI001C8BFDA5|nr:MULTISPECIES: hypothetical protein [Enterococcus]MBX9120896.1 hypothetical protein [Enterococcus sp. K18_3]MBX9127370.1 hypothetical protein [Enterococcus casseliflavus]